MSSIPAAKERPSGIDAAKDAILAYATRLGNRSLYARQSVAILAELSRLDEQVATLSRERIEACISDIKSGLCCPRAHGCEQNDDDQYCLVRQAFIRAGLLPDPAAPKLSDGACKHAPSNCADPVCRERKACLYAVPPSREA